MSKTHIIIDGKRHNLILLRVTEKDAFGRPSKADIGYDDTTFKLDGGEEFITAFVRADNTKIMTKGEA